MSQRKSKKEVPFRANKYGIPTARANKYGIPTAREWAKKQFKEYEFKRETVRDWRNKYRDIYIEGGASYPRQDEKDGGATLADWRRIG